MPHALYRNRIAYFILIILIIIIGLLSRIEIVPEFLNPLGDYFYALMCYFIIAFLFKRTKPIIIALLSVLFCYFIELSQIIQADWINAIRAYKLGGLILGYGFLWSDIISYTLAVLTGYISETKYYRKHD